jgi:NTE family protein
MSLLRSLFGPSAKPEGVVLALGGGGARGLAHVGVLEVLEEAGVAVAGIAGTSAGAIIGAMWITLGSAAAVARRWRDFLAADIVKALPDIRLTPSVSTRDNPLLLFAHRIRRTAMVALALERTSVITHADLEKGLSFLLPDVAIESLPVKFAAVATDFATGAPVALRNGRLRAAVMASCAIPAVVPPYLIAGRYLVDGGTVADVPVEQAHALCRRPVVAVSVGEALGEEDGARITLVQAMVRASNMTHKALRGAQLASADLVIAPDVGFMHWSELTRLDEAAAAGRASAERSVRRAQALARCRPRRRQAEEPQ